MTETQAQIEEILYEGLASLEDPREREDFLDQTCRGNPALRARLEKLISVSDEAEKFFIMPAARAGRRSRASPTPRTTVTRSSSSPGCTRARRCS